MSELDQQNPQMEWRPDDNASGCWVDLALTVWAPPFTDAQGVAESAEETIQRCLRQCGEDGLADAIR